MEHTIHGYELPYSYVSFFRSSYLQLTTAAEYQMAGTEKVLIAVTLFLLKSLLLRTRLTQFLYSEVALQRTFSSYLPYNRKMVVAGGSGGR